MSKHAGFSEFFEAYPSLAHHDAPLWREARLGVNEHELANWAEESVTAASADDRSHMGRIVTVIFWVVIAALLAARFFLINPAELRPAANVQTAPGATHQSVGAQ